MSKKARAVVIDCEMAGIGGGMDDVVMLCAVDYLTGAVLINKLVQPRQRIGDMRTRIHGISLRDLNLAASRGKALLGWDGARAELWKHIDGNTILIGHALRNDLDILRMIHHKVVDSELLVKNAVGVPGIRHSLAHLCDALLGFNLRGVKNDGVHDCMNDVMATREVVLFCMRQKEQFADWAEKQAIEQLRIIQERYEAREKAKEERAAAEQKEKHEKEQKRRAQRALSAEKILEFQPLNTQ